jgi:hypothetical protein
VGNAHLPVFQKPNRIPNITRNLRLTDALINKNIKFVHSNPQTAIYTRKCCDQAKAIYFKLGQLSNNFDLGKKWPTVKHS